MKALSGRQPWAWLIHAKWRFLLKALSWMIALCGLWEFGDIVAPLVPGFGTVQAFVWSHIIAGLVLMIVGAWAAMTSVVATAKTMQWIAAIAGIWLIIAPLVFGTHSVAGAWNDIAVGLIVLVLSAASRLLLQRRA